MRKSTAWFAGFVVLAISWAFWLPSAARADAGQAVENGKEILLQINDRKEIPPEEKKDVQALAEKVSKAKSPDDARRILKADWHHVVKALGSEGMKKAPPKERRRILNQAASASNQLGRYQDGIALSDQVLQENGDDRDALNNIAQSNYGIGNYEAAIRNATRAVGANPGDETAYTTRALAHYAEGNYLQAMEDAQRALALNKDDEAAFTTLKMAEARVHPPGLRLNPEQKAQAEQMKKDYQEMLRQASQVEAGSQKGLISQTAAKIRIKDYWGAIADTSKAIEARPRDAQAYYLRAAARNLAGEYGSAAQDATISLSLNQANPAAYDARAMAYNHLGRCREALDDATQAIALSPEDAYAYADRAEAYEKLGDYPSMLADYQTAARINPQFELSLRLAAKRHALPGSFFGKNSMVPVSNENPAHPDYFGGQLPWMLGSALLGLVLILAGFWHVMSPLSGSRGLTSTYKILRPISEGGMGIVYEAIDTALGRRVAIKKIREELKREPQQREKFLEEARTVAALHHPNIVEIYSILEEERDLYLVFEFVSGKSLRELLAQAGRFSAAQAVPVIRDICSALDYAHRRGVVHRDLKPSNIMITEEGQVKVMDFGIARHAQDVMSAMETTRTIIGTPQYMPPEAEQGVVRKESDVYALGVCLYELTTGKSPFAAAAHTKLSRGYPKPSRLNPELSPAFDALIDDALHPDPNRRIPSAAAFSARFSAIARPEVWASPATG